MAHPGIGLTALSRTPAQSPLAGAFRLRVGLAVDAARQTSQPLPDIFPHAAAVSWAANQGTGCSRQDAHSPAPKTTAEGNSSAARWTPEDGRREPPCRRW